MKHFTQRITLMLLLVGVFATLSGIAQTSQNLTSNKLFYYGEGKYYAYFKKGTTVTLDADGKVKSGVLAKNAILYMCSDCPVDHARFEKGTRASFADGFVRSGTLDETLVLYITDRRHAYFRAGYEVSFFPGGWVKSGTLHKNVHVYYDKNKTAVFMGGQEVTFNKDGYVSSGTLAQSVSLPTGGGHEAFQSGDYVQFKNRKVIN